MKEKSEPRVELSSEPVRRAETKRRPRASVVEMISSREDIREMEGEK